MSSERDFELANDIAERQRAVGIARVQSFVAARGQHLPPKVTGPLVCDCGEPIGEARRRAVPNTRRCVQCAMLLEKRRRRA